MSDFLQWWNLAPIVPEYVLSFYYVTIDTLYTATYLVKEPMTMLNDMIRIHIVTKITIWLLQCANEIQGH